jgi:hypothetical protein
MHPAWTEDLAMITNVFGTYKRIILRQDKTLRDHGDGPSRRTRSSVTQAAQHTTSTKRVPGRPRLRLEYMYGLHSPVAADRNAGRRVR